jgi:hypothetical protein
MATSLARNANITHNAADSSTRREYAGALTPNFIELIEKSIVVLDLAKLMLVLFVFF